MKKAVRIIIPLVLILAIIVCTGWYLFIYDREFTQDVLLHAARYFETQGNRSASTWFYNQAYRQAGDNDAVAIELANQYKASGNYTKAEYTLTNAIADGGGIDLYIALSKTYVEQDKLLDAMRMLNSITNKDIKAQLDAMRPSTPTCSPDPITAGSHYTQYITVTISSDKGTLYVNTNGLFPSTQGDLYDQNGITLKDGENTLYAIAVDENGLVSQASIFAFTVGGVIKKVDFADATVEAAFRELLNYGEGKEIYTNDLWKIQEFTVPADAKSLEDLQHLAFLEKLTIENGPSGQLTHISGLSNLEELSISGTTVLAEELNLLGRLSSLKKLTLRKCSLSTVAGLDQAKGLTYLDLSDNSLRNITPLSELQNLQEVNLSQNSLNDLLALSTLKNLTVLNVASNELSTLIPISTLSGLQQLNASGNNLTDLTGIAQLASLGHLNVSDNKITDVSPLSANTELTLVNIANNTVVDISALSALSKLANLDFSHNQVAALPQWDTSCALVNIDGSYNLLSSLEPLKGLQHLNNVFMDYNSNISSISSLTSCPVLIQVNVFGTKVKQVSALTSQGILVNYDPT